MNDKKLKVVMIDVDDCTIHDYVIDDDLNTFYNLIGCETIDIVNRSVGDEQRRFEFIIDDEGIYNNPILSAVNRNMETYFVGNIIITGKTNGDGELTSLSDDDVKYIRKHIRTIKCVTRNKIVMRPVLMDVGY